MYISLSTLSDKYADAASYALDATYHPYTYHRPPYVYGRD